jgi:hypothetical protein
MRGKGGEFTESTPIEESNFRLLRRRYRNITGISLPAQR